MLKCAHAGAALAALAALSIDPSHALAQVAMRDVAWARPESGELLARIYEPDPRPDGVLPAIIHVHQGIWNFGDRTETATLDAGLARVGFLVAAIDFRDGPEHLHPLASRDAAAAVRWLRLNAEDLGVDRARVGLMGSSSGGHLALLAGVRPDAPEHRGTPILDPAGEAGAHDDVDAAPTYVVALWPVSDPQARYRYAQRAGLEVIVNATEAYFPDEAAMLDASVPRVVTAGGLGGLPPALVVQSGDDANIPAEMTFDLLRAYQARDGKIEYAFYPDTAHVFGMQPSAATDDLIALIADFARRRGAEAER